MAGEWSDFRAFIYTTGLAIRKGEKALGREKTHLLLDGGIISCPPERQREFNSKYAEALFKGVKLFCVEMKPKHAVYMMSEFDLKLRDRPINDEELRLVVRIVQTVIVKAFPESETILAVLTAPPKPTKLKDDSPAVQSGIHFVWKIPVTLETAWSLRAWILRELDAAAGSVPWVEAWSEMYDPCIFRDNGLRMIGSNKAIICPTCNGKSFKRDTTTLGEVCFGCQNVGRIDQGRPYSLLFIADARGNPDEKLTERYKSMSNIYELVELCSIRVDPEESPVAITGAGPELLIKIVNWVKIDRAAIKGTVNNPKKKQKDKDPQAFKNAEEEAKKKQEKRDAMIDLLPDSNEYSAIATYILTEFNGSPIATHIRRTGAGDLYIINSKCKWCANKGGEHAHSNVYYMLSPKGCVQKCFCVKMQAGGACSKYTSKIHRVPIETLSIIFSDPLLNTRRKQEKRLKLAEQVMSRAGTFDQSEFGPQRDHDRQPLAAAAAAAHPYGVPQGVINLPSFRAGAAENLRRRGISKKPEYETIKGNFTPRYGVDDFLAAVQNGNFNIFK